MAGQKFRQWVESGFRDYTRDPWLFLRELAQNSRDAGAAAIRVEAKRTSDGKEVLVFTDNGCGMSFEHACQYLFRLYASSKDQDDHAAGMFGIGFWSVLRTNPERIKIESGTGKTSWAVELDRKLEIKKIPGELKKPGTRITLEWQASFQYQWQLQQAIRKALLRYCRYLRKRDRKGTPLPVFFQGENISRTMKAAGPVSLTFKNGPVEGAVGLAQEPEVLLYARGLPVWKGASLQELSHTSSAKTDNCEIAQGLAPVFLLNGNNLDVNMSRKRVMDNRALKRVKKTAEAALKKLVRFHANRAFPLGFTHRFFLLVDSLKRAWRRSYRSFWKPFLLLLVVVIPLEIVLLHKFYAPGIESRSTPVIFFLDQDRYEGATVKTISRETPLAMSYKPPVKTWFKIFTAESYNLNRGFIRGREQDRSSSLPPPHPCSNSPFTLQLKLNRGGKIFLPQPVGYTTAPGSVTCNNKPLHRLKFNASGEVVIDIPGGGGMLRCRCCPIKNTYRGKNLTPENISSLTNLPEGLEIPASLDAELDRHPGLDIDQKIKKALELTRSILKYDDSKSTAEQYKDSSAPDDWFLRVTQIGKGDCDIMNGITVILLRRMGIPARLVVGLTGDKGKILPGMHAWTEYFHQGWHVLDSSISQPAPFVPSAEPGLSSKNTSYHSRRQIANPGKPLLYFFITIILLLSPIFFLVYNKKKKEEHFAGSPQESDKETIRATLAQMAAGALLKPGVWGRDNHIRYYRILPTITLGNRPNQVKKNISLEKALSLAKAGKLLKSQRDNPLIRQFLRSAAVILDKDDPAFSSLICLLPGVIDLDMIVSFRAAPPETIENNEVATLLVIVNRLLKRIKMDCPNCMWAPGLKNQDCFDVDLPGTRKFIAVNPSSSRIGMLAWLFSRNPQLAVFSLTKKLVRESRLFTMLQDRILKKAAVMLLKEIS